MASQLAVRYALFSIAGGRFAVPIEKVLHMLPWPKVHTMPLMNPLFSGVCLYQEQLVPVVDAACLIRNASDDAATPALLIVCEAEYGPVAFPAEKVDRITAPEKETGVDHETDAGCAALISSAGSTWKLLDLNQLLEAPGGETPNLSG